MSDAAWEARSLFKFTYYPSQDSLVVEPMNALSKNPTSDVWQNADYAFNSTNNNENAIHVDATPTEADLNKDTYG